MVVRILEQPSAAALSRAPRHPALERSTRSHHRGAALSLWQLQTNLSPSSFGLPFVRETSLHCLPSLRSPHPRLAPDRRSAHEERAARSRNGTIRVLGRTLVPPPFVTRPYCLTYPSSQSPTRPIVLRWAICWHRRRLCCCALGLPSVSASSGALVSGSHVRLLYNAWTHGSRVWARRRDPWRL